MSIDREINARVDAYRNNPNELKKKYSVSKELVDLIALQKIKKGMDAERNSIALAMQTDPSTIKSQLENEVRTRTAQDVAKQLGGVFRNKQAQQQKGLNRLAQRAAAPKGPQGLGALMPQQGQRPQTRMMQAGGIVSFSGEKGSRVEGDVPNNTPFYNPEVRKEMLENLVAQGVSEEALIAKMNDMDLLPQAKDRVIQMFRRFREKQSGMQAGGIVSFNGEEGSRVEGANDQQVRTFTQIQQLLASGMSPEEVKQEIPPAYAALVDEVVRASLTTAPAGMMEEVVTTQQERAQPVQTVDKPSSREVEPVSPGARIDVTDYSQLLGPTKTRSPKKIAETPEAKDITPEKSAPEKKTYSKPEGIIETLFGEYGAILPLGLNKESGIRDRVQYAIDTNVPLSRFPTEQLQRLRSDNNQYTPKIEAELARRQAEPKQGITAVAEGTTAAPQAQPSQDKVEGIAAAETSVVPMENVERALGLGGQGKQTPSPSLPPSQPVQTGIAQGQSRPSGMAERIDLQTMFEEMPPAPVPEPTDRTNLDANALERLKQLGMDPTTIDVEKAGADALRAAETYYDVAGKDREARAGLEALINLDKSQTSPEELRYQKLMSFLGGGAGRGRSVLAGAGAAAENTRRAQQRDIRARQVERNEMLSEIQRKDNDLRKLAKADERSALDRANQQKIVGLNYLSNASAAELQARIAEGNRIHDTNLANFRTKMDQVSALLAQQNSVIDESLRRAELASMDSNRRIMALNAGIDDAMNTQVKISTLIAEATEDAISQDTEIMMKNAQLGDSDLSAEERNAIATDIRNRQAEIVAGIEIRFAKQFAKIEELKDSILQMRDLRQQELGGVDYNIGAEGEGALSRNLSQ